MKAETGQRKQPNNAGQDERSVAARVPEVLCAFGTVSPRQQATCGGERSALEGAERYGACARYVCVKTICETPAQSTVNASGPKGKGVHETKRKRNGRAAGLGRVK